MALILQAKGDLSVRSAALTILLAPHIMPPGKLRSRAEIT
jgi:hypothetical protein